MIIFSVSGRNQRKVELENALNNAMQTALEGIMEPSEYSPTSNEELIADFQQAFFMQINSKSDITLNVLYVDYEKGILCVEAVSEFNYLTGAKGSVAVTKNIILDIYEDELKKTTNEVTFYVTGVPYRNYTYFYDVNIVAPPTPTKEGETFLGWSERTTDLMYTADTITSLQCDRKMEFDAVFE